MSRAVFTPFAYAQGAMSLDVSLTDVGWTQTPSGSILLDDDVGRFENVSVDVRVGVPAGTFEYVVPDVETAGDPGAVQVAVLYKCIACRIRGMALLAQGAEDGAYHGRLSFPTRALAGSLDIRPAIVRVAPITAPSGWAGHRAAILADGPPQRILLAERAAPPGAYADIEYDDFATSASARRRATPRALISIDLAGGLPKLWLNSSIPQLELITRSHARRGAPRRIRDATFDTIVTQGWTAILGCVIASTARLADGDMSPDEIMATLPEWQGRVLDAWAPRLFAELHDTGEAIEEFCRAAGDLSRIPELQERVVDAVQLWAQSADAFEGLMRFINGEGL